MGEVNKVRKAKDSEKIKNLVDQWVKNKKYLMHDIGVEKLGKVLGINRTYISNYINDTYQTNFNTWIQRLIMENPQTALGQIASMTGYTDQAHFCKQFRVVTGTSPTKWRKENADN